MTPPAKANSMNGARAAATTEVRNADEAYQRHSLQGVSRTFALTIPALPKELCRVVGNAYLLCRIADTVEDEADLTAAQKRYFSEYFVRVLSSEASAADFAQELHPLLSSHTLDAERDLICNAPRVIRVTESFNEVQRNALRRCVRIMSHGMAEFQENKNSNGLKDLSHLDRYCYHVAGVVGEMLTELFCDQVKEVREHRETLLRLGVSFGQGLQMTNILKDIWEDRERGACWLPQDVFRGAGFDLAELAPGVQGQGFTEGLERLIGIAQGHLRNALEYTLYFPKTEIGIRRFCLWALGMAVLSLRKIHRHPDFRAGKQVKISRRSVKLTVLTTNLAARHDAILRLMFDWLTRGLPSASGFEGITSRS